MSKDILIHLATGFEEIEAITIIDVLRRANLSVKTVSITNKLDVEGAHQITIVADQLFEETNYDQAEMIVLPGGMPGTSNLQQHEGLAEKIIQFNRNKRAIAAICAAPSVLGVHGILDGKKAVCYPGVESKLTGATILHTPFITDGNIITGRGVGTALEFSLELVRILKGNQLAASLREALVIPS